MGHHYPTHPSNADVVSDGGIHIDQSVPWTCSEAAEGTIKSMMHK